MTRLQPVGQAKGRVLWLEEALAAEPEAEHVEPLAGAHRADVCVIGGGYSGLWTALRLKEWEPGLDVVLLEAGLCGGGASGRNGGFALSWWAKLRALVTLCGEEEALRLGRAAEDAVLEIGRFCARHGIDAHYRQAGWLWGATTPRHVGAWDATVRACEERGIDVFERLTPVEVVRRTGSATHLAGVCERTGATVQPALLARGLRRVAIERGVHVFERSPVHRLDRATPPVARTPHGAVVAERVVLATNAWAASLPELRRALLPMASDMVATAPVPERLAEIGWTGGECVSDARLMVHYYRTTRDGRIAFGRGGEAHAYLGRVTPVFDDPGRRGDRTEGAFRRTYPMLGDVPITHRWTGVVDRSETNAPFFGRLGGDPRIVYGVGYSGNGVAPTLVGARILASAVLERRDEWAETPLNRGPRSLFPPDPARFFGGLLVRAAVKRKEVAEDAGREAGPIVRAVAGLAPAGMRKGAEPTAREMPSASQRAQPSAP